MTGGAAAGMPGLLAGYLLRTTVVLTLALAAAALSRRRPAALRHFILSVALIGLLLLPFLSLAPVGWRSTLVPRWLAPSVTPARATPAAAAEGPGRPIDAVQPAGTASFPFVSRDVLPPLIAAGPGAVGRAGESAVSVLSVKESPLSPGRPETPATPGKNGRGRALDLALALLWSAGMAVLVLRLGIGLAGAVRLTWDGTPLGGPSWRALLERFLAIVPLRKKVRLRSHPEVLVPLTWGWRRPVVLMPKDADGWSEEDRSSALFHELSHIRRSDFVVMLLVRASLALFWWNPLSWVVYRELLKEQELACDELVLRAGIRPSSYAASLLAFRRSSSLGWNPSAALPGMLGRSPFQERLAAILRHKLILTEVKMKTKIMLALALGLAVAVVGTARPVPAAGTNGGTTVLGETAAPAPPAFEAALLAAPSFGQETAATAVQEKEQEKAQAEAKAKEAEKAKAVEEKAAKEKAAVAKTIVIAPKGGGDEPLEIIITEGGETKTLVVGKPLVIKKDKDGSALTLSVDGKDIEILKGEPLRLEIKGGKLEVVREPGVVVAGERGNFKIVKEGGEEGQAIVVYSAKEPKVVGEKVKIVKEGEPATAWTVIEGGKAGGKNFAFSAGLSDKEMLEKVRALEEQVQAIKAKKMDLSALEESLKKLEVELQAKEEKLKELQWKFEKAPGQYTVVKRVGGEEAERKGGVWIMEKKKAAEEAKAKVTVGIEDKDFGSISLVFTGQEGEAGQAAFERAVAALKKDLPEGYKIEKQDFDAEKGVMTFKISAPEGGKTDEALVKKLVESAQAAIKTGK